MKTGAVICEYNPLHNGHVHHIRETKNAGVTHLIALLSADFVQRGDVALLDKFDRAELAVHAGADLVLELPVPYSCASAEFYAGGAVQILKRLNMIDVLSFGCSGNLKDLENLVQISEEIKNRHQDRIREKLRAGCSYPLAVWEVMGEIGSPELSALLRDPNDILALEYLRAMKKYQAGFEAFAVRRETVMHDSSRTVREFASAGHIRELFASQGDYRAFVPDFTEERLSGGETALFSRLGRVILYRMRMMTESELLTLPDMTPDLAKRFLNARHENSLTDFLNAVKTRCFTMARIRRIVLSGLIGVQKADLQTEIPYIRVLAFSRKGAELLKFAKSRSKIPFGTSLTKLQNLSPEARRFAELDVRTADVYGLAKMHFTSAEQTFRRKIIMMED